MHCKKNIYILTFDIAKTTIASHYLTFHTECGKASSRVLSLAQNSRPKVLLAKCSKAIPYS